MIWISYLISVRSQKNPIRKLDNRLRTRQFVRRVLSSVIRLEFKDCGDYSVSITQWSQILFFSVPFAKDGSGLVSSPLHNRNLIFEAKSFPLRTVPCIPIRPGGWLWESMIDYFDQILFLIDDWSRTNQKNQSCHYKKMQQFNCLSYPPFLSGRMSVLQRGIYRLATSIWF